MKQRPSHMDKCQRIEKRQQKLHRIAPLQQIAPNRRRLPDRWIDYDPVGKDMTGTRFVAFKTPLRHDYFLNRNDEFDIQNIFETKNLIDMISFLICILECTKNPVSESSFVGQKANAAGKQIGLVIDLTATQKYYDPREWNDMGVKYEKIWCTGHHLHIQMENIQKFYNIVSDFLSKYIHTGQLIGVHCTHGLNRTGYMICRYLIEVDGWDVNSAIEQFEYCRGYKIERKNYIDSLRNDCVRGKYASLSVEYPGKPIDGIINKQMAQLKNVLPCIDLNEFAAAV